MFTCSVLSVEKYADGKQNAAKIFTGAHTPKHAKLCNIMQGKLQHA